jgi:hypothetical protein
MKQSLYYNSRCNVKGNETSTLFLHVPNLILKVLLYFEKWAQRPSRTQDRLRGNSYFENFETVVLIELY